MNHAVNEGIFLYLAALLLSPSVVSLTASSCNSIGHCGSVFMKFERLLFDESFSRKERKGAKTAAPRHHCERCEKHDDPPLAN
jgi:hypothetical protein